jgi:hypothetical protein
VVRAQHIYGALHTCNKISHVKDPLDKIVKKQNNSSFSYSLLACHGNAEQLTIVWFLPGLSCMSYEAYLLEDPQGDLRGRCIGTSVPYFLNLMILQSSRCHQDLISLKCCHYNKEINISTYKNVKKKDNAWRLHGAIFQKDVIFRLVSCFVFVNVRLALTSIA